MKSYLKRKGVSPLIASVLLIAFTMAIAAVLTAWITQFTAEKQEAAEASNVKFKCVGSAITVDSDFTTWDALNKKLYVEIKNTGAATVVLSGIKYWRDTDKTPQVIEASTLSETKVDEGKTIKLTISGFLADPKEVKFETNCEIVSKTINRPIGGWTAA